MLLWRTSIVCLHSNTSCNLIDMEQCLRLSGILSHAGKPHTTRSAHWIMCSLLHSLHVSHSVDKVRCREFIWQPLKLPKIGIPVNCKWKACKLQFIPDMVNKVFLKAASHSGASQEPPSPLESVCPNTLFRTLLPPYFKCSR